MNIYYRLIKWSWATAVLGVALMGCATVYEVHSCHGEVCTDVYAKSWRNFEQPSVSYVREDGTAFNFNAGSATAQVSPLEQAAAGIITALPVLLNAPATATSTGPAKDADAPN